MNCTAGTSLANLVSAFARGTPSVVLYATAVGPLKYSLSCVSGESFTAISARVFLTTTYFELVSRTCLRSSVTCGTVIPLNSSTNAFVAWARLSLSSETAAAFSSRFMRPPYSAFASAMAASIWIEGLIVEEM